MTQLGSSYRVKLSKDAEKGLLKIDQSLPAVSRKVSYFIEGLKKNPFLGMKLKGSDRDTRRIRVGDYRIIYEVYKDLSTILVVYIGPRGGAY